MKLMSMTNFKEMYCQGIPHSSYYKMIKDPVFPRRNLGGINIIDVDAVERMFSNVDRQETPNIQKPSGASLRQKRIWKRRKEAQAKNKAIAEKAINFSKEIETVQQNAV